MPSKTTTIMSQAAGTATASRTAPARTAASRPPAASAPGEPGSANTSALLRAREMPGFTLGHSRTDIRGWQVYSNDAELVGSVGSLFVDIRTKAVRYLGVVLGAAGGRTGAREILVPVGSVSRPDDRQVVVVNALSASQLGRAPRISKRAMTRMDENATLAAYGMPTWGDAQPSDLYSTPNFEEQHLFGTPAHHSPVA